jgi:hypothetical protein
MLLNGTISDVLHHVHLSHLEDKEGNDPYVYMAWVGA